MKYEIKNLKTFMGMDTPGFNCSLYRDGKKVADVIDDGGGGETQFFWVDQMLPKEPVDLERGGVKVRRICTREEANFLLFTKDMTFPVTPGMEAYGPLPMGMGGYVDELINLHKEQKMWKRKCAKSTCFRLVGDDNDHYREIKRPFTLFLKSRIVNEYGDRLKEIINETIGQEAK